MYIVNCSDCDCEYDAHHFTECPDCDSRSYHAKPDTTNHCPECEARAKELTASEAIFAFFGWLTNREKTTIMSVSDDAAPIAELIKEFCEVNELPDPRDDYADYFKMPKEAK